MSFFFDGFLIVIECRGVLGRLFAQNYIFGISDVNNVGSLLINR